MRFDLESVSVVAVGEDTRRETVSLDYCSGGGKTVGRTRYWWRVVGRNGCG